MDLDRPVAVRIDENRLALVDLLAEEADIGRSAMIRRLIDEAVEARVGNPGKLPPGVVVLSKGVWDEAQKTIAKLTAFVRRIGRDAEALEELPMLKGQRK